MNMNIIITAIIVQLVLAVYKVQQYLDTVFKYF